MPVAVLRALKFSFDAVFYYAHDMGRSITINSSRTGCDFGHVTRPYDLGH